MPLPPEQPSLNPVYSPAPNPPVIDDEPEVPDAITKRKGNLSQHEFLLRLNDKGYATVDTPELVGYLEYVRITQTMPSRIFISNIIDQRHVIYNNARTGLFEEAYIRVRTQDQNARFHSEPTRVLLNAALRIIVQGSPFQDCHVIITMVKA